MSIKEAWHILGTHQKVLGEDGKSYHQWQATFVQLGTLATAAIVAAGGAGWTIYSLYEKQVESKVREAIKGLEATNMRLSSDLAAANNRPAEWSKCTEIRAQANGATQSPPSRQLSPSIPPQAEGSSSPPDVVAKSAPKDLSLGRIATKISLLNDATWTAPTSPIPRKLHFAFEGFASYIEGVRIGRVQMTLLREGRELCTISLTTAGSPANNRGVGDKSPSCSDEIPQDQTFTYRARVTADGLTPEKVLVTAVEATPL